MSLGFSYSAIFPASPGDFIFRIIIFIIQGGEKWDYLKRAESELEEKRTKIELWECL